MVCSLGSYTMALSVVVVSSTVRVTALAIFTIGMFALLAQCSVFGICLLCRVLVGFSPVAASAGCWQACDSCPLL